MAYTRKNRRNHSTIKLTESIPTPYNPSCYWLDCVTHQTRGPVHYRKNDALVDMSHPWRWCEKCADPWRGAPDPANKDEW